MKKKSKVISEFRVKEEYLFVLVALLFGVLFTFLNPPAQSNDEDRHFFNAYARSEFKFIPEQRGDAIGYDLPSSVIQVVSAYQGVNYPGGSKIKKSSIDNFSKVPLNPDVKEFYNHPNYGINPISYLPYILGINIGKIINSNPMYLIWSARISGLIFYIIVVFFAIRLVPVFKGVFMLFALSPMALYQASSVTYDVMSISLGLLLSSLIIKMSLSKDTIPFNEIIWLVVIAFFHRFAKDGYIFIPFLLLIVPVAKFKTKYIYYLLLAYFVILIFLPGWTWGAMMGSAQLSGGRPLQTDFLFDQSKNLSYHLSHPFAVVGHLIMNILAQGGEWIYGAFARFGYAYAIPSKMIITFHVIILLTVALFDSKKDVILPNRVKYGTLIIGIAGILAIIGGFFITGSPVGSYMVFGLQGRYFLPFIPLLLLVIYNNKYHKPVFEKYGGVIIAVYSIIILSYMANFINTYFYAE